MHSSFSRKIALTFSTGSTIRRLLALPATAAIGILSLTLCNTALADTLTPGSTLTVDFTASSNQSDLLVFGSGFGMTASSSAVVTTELFNGNTLLGTATSPVLSFYGEQYFSAFFKDPESQYTDSSPVSVNLSSIMNGTVAGKLVLNVTGGSLNYSTNFYLQDAKSCGSGCYTPKYDISVTDYKLAESTPASSTPEPASASLAGAAVASLFFLGRRASQKS